MAEVGNNSQRRKTSKSVLIGLFLSVVVLMLSIVWWWLAHIRWPVDHRPSWCSSNMSGLVKAMLVYANDDEFGRPPAAEKWCDLLIQEDFTTYKSFRCPSSDAVEGESSYAMNKYVAGKDMSKLPPDVVVLFETNFGRPSGWQAGTSERAGVL